jgi:hypothetical protein
VEIKKRKGKPTIIIEHGANKSVTNPHNPQTFYKTWLIEKQNIENQVYPPQRGKHKDIENTQYITHVSTFYMHHIY